ncbi:SUR7/PalI family-domain-containing protein [Xylariales sp. PMI_506]|nr:SUR7/PalI family-domain-containing protein [Xylariales sp. PMI_506]
MLRPATPLAIALFLAFGLLLLSVLSTPIIQVIPLGSLDGVDMGVFGYCKNNACSSIEIGYDTSSLFSATDSSSFDLPSGTRKTLSAILVVHPVACLFTLIMLIMAIAAHFHAPSHSSRYLLVLFIFGIVTFVLCLLAFLVDVLLFVPHMAWGSYVVCAATVLVALSGLVSCAMRRTVVSRKARKKRIAENAEMSGENYYNRNAQQDATIGTGTSAQPTVPVLSGANGPNDKLETFTSYEQKKDDRSSDERIPLTASSPVQRSPGDMSNSDANYLNRSGSNPSLPRDQYGNPIQQSQDPYGMRRPSTERSAPRARGGPAAGYRGRGGYGRGGYGPAGYGGPPPPPGSRSGYGPSGRGGYGPGPNGRGGYPPRGNYGPGGARGGRPPPGYGADGYDRRPPPQNGYGNYGTDQRSSPVPAGPYGSNRSLPTGSTGTVGTSAYEAYNPDRASDLPRAESPPPLPGTEEPKPSSGVGVVGQAVEMDAATGSPAHPPQGFGNFPNQLRESDADVAGMLALQQARTDSPKRHDTYFSEGSKYSQDEQYLPPRQGWHQGPGRSSPRMPSPLNLPARTAELPGGTSAAGGAYYEDVDPRFADSSAPGPTSAPQTLQIPAIPESTSYDDPHNDGARSPTASERSTFTSISQRGINPRWNPPPAPPGGFNAGIPRRPVNRNEVNILNSNPDFQLPTNRGGSASPANRRIIPGSAYPPV